MASMAARRVTSAASSGISGTFLPDPRSVGILAARMGPGRRAIERRDRPPPDRPLAGRLADDGAAAHLRPRQDRREPVASDLPLADVGVPVAAGADGERGVVRVDEDQTPGKTGRSQLVE